MDVVPLREEHWPGVLEVYEAGIATGHATFETAPPSWQDFDASRLPEHRFVALAEGRVLGWVGCSSTSSRHVYRGVVEHSVYVAPDVAGRGTGRALLERLVASTEGRDVWTIQSGIFPENTASLALHRACGFREVGVRERVGLMRHGPLAGHWRDVVLVERRSALAGV